MSLFSDIFGSALQGMGQFGQGAQQWVTTSGASQVYPIQDKPKAKDRKLARLSMVKAALASLPPIADAEEAARQAVMRADIILAMLETEEKLKE